MKKAIIVIIAVVIATTAVFFLWNNPLKQNDKVLASLDVSTEGGAVSLPDNSFVVAVPRGALRSTEKISIVKPLKIPTPRVGDIVVAYEVISSTNLLDVPATIEFKAPSTSNNDNRSLEDLYTIMFYDDETGVYVESPCNYDYTDGKISTQTYHFSLWALVSLEKYTVAHSPNFKVMFNSSTIASGLGGRDIYEFVAKVRGLLEDAYSTYIQLGFTKPRHKISVYVIESEESYYTPLTGNIIISSISPSDNETKHEIAHELFHLFQNQDMNYLLMNKHRWWVEATADYAADKLVFNTGQMGSGIKTNYYELPLSTVDGNHEYATAFFVDWLVKTVANYGDNFTSLWKVVASRSLLHSAEASLDNYLNERFKSSLLEEYSWFINFLLFDEKSPIKTPGNQYPSNMASIQELLSPQSRSKVIRASIDGPYSSRIIALRCEMPSGMKDVLLTVSAIEDASSNVKARAILLRDNDRASAELIGVFDKARKQVEVRVGEKDYVYIVLSASSAPLNLAFNTSMIYGEVGEFLISLSNTYNTTIEYTLRGNSLSVDVKGSVRGPIIAGRMDKIPGAFGEYGSVNVLVHTASTPTELNLNIKYRFANGTTWIVRTSEGYIRYTILEAKTIISYNEILPSCSISQENVESFTRDEVSWSYSTRIINYTTCTPDRLLGARISIIWKIEITTIRVDPNGAERITGASTVEDYVPVLNISILSIQK